MNGVDPHGDVEHLVGARWCCGDWKQVRAGVVGRGRRLSISRTKRPSPPYDEDHQLALLNNLPRGHPSFSPCVATATVQAIDQHGRRRRSVLVARRVV